MRNLLLGQLLRVWQSQDCPMVAVEPRLDAAWPHPCVLVCHLSLAPPCRLTKLYLFFGKMVT